MGEAEDEGHVNHVAAEKLMTEIAIKHPTDEDLGTDLHEDVGLESSSSTEKHRFGASCDEDGDDLEVDSSSWESSSDGGSWTNHDSRTLLPAKRKASQKSQPRRKSTRRGSQTSKNDEEIDDVDCHLCDDGISTAYPPPWFAEGLLVHLEFEGILWPGRLELDLVEGWCFFCAEEDAITVDPNHGPWYYQLSAKELVKGGGTRLHRGKAKATRGGMC